MRRLRFNSMGHLHKSRSYAALRLIGEKHIALRLRRLMCGRSVTFREKAYSPGLCPQSQTRQGIAPEEKWQLRPDRSQTYRTSGGTAAGTIFLLIVLFFCVFANAQTPNSAHQVTFTRGTLSIPTYTINRSETVAPLFKAADSAALYPYARLDRDTMNRKPVPVRYEALTLENEYLRVVILPELGGRLWSARDKTANREIFYYTSVIKPTVYNQRGGWPAGNLEVYGPYDAHMLTWPGEPWPWAFRRNNDGSATVILSHIDHFFRNKIAMEVTLHPGRSFIELTLQCGFPARATDISPPS